MTTIRSRDPQARCAIVVGLGARGALAPLIRHLAAAEPIDWLIAPDVSGCLYHMALREADLLLFSREAAGGGRAIAEILARCRPSFEGCVIIAGDGAIDLHPGSADERWAWLPGPLVQICDELGWSIVHHDPWQTARAAGDGVGSAAPA